MLSVISQMKKDKYHMTSLLHCIFKKKKKKTNKHMNRFIRQTTDQWLPEGKGGREKANKIKEVEYMATDRN